MYGGGLCCSSMIWRTCNTMSLAQGAKKLFFAAASFKWSIDHPCNNRNASGIDGHAHIQGYSVAEWENGRDDNTIDALLQDHPSG